MKAWGNPVHTIEIVKWGCFDHSLAILKGRTQAKHVRSMVTNIQRRQVIMAVARAHRKGE
jgi:hypothetical protein